MTDLLITATQETCFMMAISTIVGFIIGLPLAIILFGSQHHALFHNRFLHKFMGFVINAVRSIPYIILMIAIIPVTRFIVGSSLGTGAACVPLSIASVMLVARLAEESFRNVPEGLIQAAQSMGATKKQIICKIIIPESLPSLISGMTLVMISLIGFSAMAGAVGGGGLGDLALRYGYQRYNMEMILEIMVILVLLVQIIQMTGDYLTRRLTK